MNKRMMDHFKLKKNLFFFFGRTELMMKRPRYRHERRI